MVKKITKYFCIVMFIVYGVIFSYLSFFLGDLYFSMWAFTNVVLMGIFVNTLGVFDGQKKD